MVCEHNNRLDLDLGVVGYKYKQSENSFRVACQLSLCLLITYNFKPEVSLMILFLVILMAASSKPHFGPQESCQ